jgi:hypothetical protein
MIPAKSLTEYAAVPADFKTDVVGKAKKEVDRVRSSSERGKRNCSSGPGLS